MATTYTSRTKLAKPGPADREWNLPLNANAEALDALAPVGGLCVTSTEVPSTSLRVQAAPGRYQQPDGSINAFAGATFFPLPANATSYLYINSLNALASSIVGFPATTHVPLAAVETSAAAIQSIVDLRVVCGVTGTGSRPYLPLSGGTLTNGATIAAGTAAGLKIGAAPSQKLGFWGAAPIARPPAFTQTYAVSTHVVGSYTPNAMSASFSGIASGQAGSPYAQAADINNLRVAYENLRNLSENTTQALNGLINDLKSIGLLG